MDLPHLTVGKTKKLNPISGWVRKFALGLMPFNNDDYGPLSLEDIWNHPFPSRRHENWKY
jgi:hypothetical protein